MKALSKLQIETAQEVLIKAINNKKKTIATAAFLADTKKFGPKVVALHKLAYDLRQKALALKEEVQKNPKLCMEVDSGYDNYLSKLPKTLEEAEDSAGAIKPRNSSYSNNLGEYAPDMTKEEAEVEQFILNLKLGTALMSDLQTLLDKINKVK